MPHRYTRKQKDSVRHLMNIHNGDLTLISQLSGIPRRTLYDWRMKWKHDEQDDGGLSARKNFLSPSATNTPQAPSDNESDESDMAEDIDLFAEFTHIRQIMVNHARTLARDLLLEDEYISLRALALSRLIDRILQLDAIIPEKNLEKVVRFEYVYNGSVHNTPPWAGASDDMPKKLPPTEDLT